MCAHIVTGKNYLISMYYYNIHSTIMYFDIGKWRMLFTTTAQQCSGLLLSFCLVFLWSGAEQKNAKNIFWVEKRPFFTKVGSNIYQFLH